MPDLTYKGSYDKQQTIEPEMGIVSMIVKTTLSTVTDYWQISKHI